MIEQKDKPSVLIVISSLSIGGPQKSLIGLFDRLDFKEIAVDLLVLGESGSLSAWVPENVRILSTPAAIRAATLPRDHFVSASWMLVRVVNWKRLVPLFYRLLKGFLTCGGQQRTRQYVWSEIHQDLPKISGEYDMAFGILGLSTYVVLDLVNARFKYHWIRSDTRVLLRDESIDSAYYQRLDGAIAVSNQCSSIFADLYPSFERKIFVYKNDIPRSRRSGELPFDLGVRTTTLLTMSRLDRLKGIELAIEACRLLVDRGHDVQWIVVGEGPERAALQTLVESRGLTSHFYLVGSVMDTTTCVEAATIYVHPSRTEGRSNSVEEARAAGKPIVATAYETVADQVENGKTGLVCEIDFKEIAFAIEQLLRDPQLAAKLGIQARDAYGDEIGSPMRMFTLLGSGRMAELLGQLEA